MQSIAKSSSMPRLRASRSACVKVQASAQQRVLITGANTGIGYQTALGLVKKDFEIVMACRDMDKAESAMQSLRSAVPGCKVSGVKLDLTDMASIRECASQLLDQQAFDVVLNNAGVMATPKMTTKDGFEFQLGTNHLGHFLLTSLLLPALKEAGKPVRIINVASEAHYFGKIDFDDLFRDKVYTPWEAYGQSKLANVMYTYELARRLGATHPNITTNCLHPGVVNTELGRYMFSDADKNELLRSIVMAAASSFLKTPAQGAETSIYLASSPEVANVSGKYYDNCKPKSTSRASYNVDVARRFYDLSSELTQANVPAARKPLASVAA